MKLSENCYAVTGLYYESPWSVNAGFIVGYEKTLVIDSGSNSISAQTIFGYADVARPGNEIILINTERHLDHIGGNGYFSEKGISIYGHSSINRDQNEFLKWLEEINSHIPNVIRRNKKEGFIAYKNTTIVNPDKIIDEDFQFELGGKSAQAILTPGHTKSNLSVYQKDDKVLYCGDCILPDFIPNLEEGSNTDWQSWVESLERIKEFDIDIIVPGHGNVISGKENIKIEIERTQSIIISAIKNNKAPTII